jgi:hypothetical protein
MVEDLLNNKDNYRRMMIEQAPEYLYLRHVKRNTRQVTNHHG